MKKRNRDMPPEPTPRRWLIALWIGWIVLVGLSYALQYVEPACVLLGDPWNLCSR